MNAQCMFIFKPLGCLQQCLPWGGLMDTPATSQKCSASSSLTAEVYHYCREYISALRSTLSYTVLKAWNFYPPSCRLHVACALIRNRSLANLSLPSNFRGFERVFECYIRSGSSLDSEQANEIVQLHTSIEASQWKYCYIMKRLSIKNKICWLSTTKEALNNHQTLLLTGLGLGTRLPQR